MAWWLVTTAARGAAVGRGGVEACRAAGAAGRMPDLVFAAAITKDERPAVVVTFGAAPGTAAISSEHPHEEGGVTIELEVEGASLA